MFDYERYKTPRKIVLLLLALALAGFGAREFTELRTMKETVVVSDAFTQNGHAQRLLSPIKGTGVDAGLHLRLGVPGGSMFYLGGTHPTIRNELSAYVMMENLKVEKESLHLPPPI